MAALAACYGGRSAMESALEHATFAELVQRGAAGEAAAEAEVCRRFAPRIRLYGLKHLRTEDAAAELVQRVLVAVIEALRVGRVEEPHHFERFVLGTCRNVAGRMRSTDARTEATDPAVLEGFDTAATFAPLVALDVERLMHCIYKLELRARTVLHLSFYRERSAEQIGEAMGLTPGNVRVMRHRAMAALRACMESREAA